MNVASVRRNSGSYLPCRFSRNPIYLSFILLVLGLSAWLNNLWLLVMLIPAVGFIAAVVIHEKNGFLSATFPASMRATRLPFARGCERAPIASIPGSVFSTLAFHRVRG